MLTIIHNHKDWVIVDKPAGISMQQEQTDSEHASLLQLALQACQHLDHQIKRLWPVHRLDKATSGLVIFAKSAAAAARFGELFANKQIAKHYLAIALGKPKKKQGWIKGDMEKGRNGSWLLKRSLMKPAITYFQSCAISQAAATSQTKRLYLVSPKSGKTHQIRVALKSIGCPILGDLRYKGEGADRCYLHAFSLRFDWQGKAFQFLVEPTQGSWPELNPIELLSEFYNQV
jgi:tRNA pseudouridine32 synthase/23S rRNA pseudouridine746 synthase